MQTKLADGGDEATILTLGVTKGRDYAWQGAIDRLRVNSQVFDFEASGVIAGGRSLGLRGGGGGGGGSRFVPREDRAMLPRRLRGRRARDGVRTRDIQLGRLALYQLSYSRIGLRIAGTPGETGLPGTTDRRRPVASGMGRGTAFQASRAGPTRRPLQATGSGAVW
jgi:hypothetical protein